MSGEKKSIAQSSYSAFPNLSQSTTVNDDDSLIIIDSSTNESSKINLQLLNQPISSEDKTGNYNITTNDRSKLINLYSASSDVTFQLPAVGSSDDGMTFWIANNSRQKLTITTPDKKIGYPAIEKITSIDLPYSGTTIKVRFHMAQNRWDIIEKCGGKIIPSNLMLYMSCNGYAATHTANNFTYQNFRDETLKHNLYAVSNVALNKSGVEFSQDTSDAKFGSNCLIFNGPTYQGYILSENTSDWNFFGPTFNDLTISFWVYRTTSNQEWLFSQYDNVNSGYWGLYHSSGTLTFTTTNSCMSPSSASGGTIPINTWSHIVLILSGGNIGAYIDSNRVFTASQSSYQPYTGILEIGRNFSSSNYFNGRMDDICIIRQNIYDVNPSTYGTLPNQYSTQPLNLVT